jgi:DNA-binding NarL/FixJ family response regulator
MKKILLVDDDLTLRNVLRHYLESQGYHVEDVASGEAGLEAFNTYAPDLVVSDVAMMGIDGFEFCRQLRSQPSGQLVPFIFLSGRDEVADRVQGHTTGADGYITKPFEIQELLAKIEGLLERSRRIHAEIIQMMQQIIANREEKTKDPQNLTPISQNREDVEQSPEKLDPLPLTPAEQRVFWEVIQGLSNKQISENLYISPRTVQTHLSNILSKLELENRTQLVKFAYDKGYQKAES